MYEVINVIISLLFNVATILFFTLKLIFMDNNLNQNRVLSTPILEYMVTSGACPWFFSNTNVLFIQFFQAKSMKLNLITRTVSDLKNNDKNNYLTRTVHRHKNTSWLVGLKNGLSTT